MVWHCGLACSPSFFRTTNQAVGKRFITMAANRLRRYGHNRIGQPPLAQALPELIAFRSSQAVKLLERTIGFLLNRGALEKTTAMANHVGPQHTASSYYAYGVERTDGSMLAALFAIKILIQSGKSCGAKCVSDCYFIGRVELPNQNLQIRLTARKSIILLEKST
jgi:hypothetical protein